MELRCPNEILHGVVNDDFIEVKCRSNRCGHRTGVVVMHRFNVITGELVSTQLFRETPTKERKDGAPRERTAVRSS
jgi:hypothetical protein